MRQTFNIGFLCRQSKASKKTGLAPIELSIIINGQRTYIALQRKEQPEVFKNALESKKDNPIKQYCDCIRQKVDDISEEMMRNNIPLTAEYLKDYFKRGGVKEGYYLSQLFDDFLQIKAKENIEPVVYKRYEKARDIFYNRCGFTGRELALSVDISHIRQLKSSLSGDYGTNYVSQVLGKIKSAFVYAFERGKIPSIPFAGIKLERISDSESVRFLTDDELEKLRHLELDSPHLERVKDLFLFQCGSGVSVSDLMKLVPDDFQLDFKTGSFFIKKKRQKTETEFTAVLIDDASRIYEQYEGELPKMSPQKYNDYLKVLGAYTGIERLTTHMARHTYATRLLNSGIPIEIVQKSLGHSSPYMTRIYAKLLDRSVIDKVSRLSKRKIQVSYC